jgi:hypothetical protein
MTATIVAPESTGGLMSILLTAMICVAAVSLAAMVAIFALLMIVAHSEEDEER